MLAPPPAPCTIVCGPRHAARRRSSSCLALRQPTRWLAHTGARLRGHPRMRVLQLAAGPKIVQARGGRWLSCRGG